jgi:hypothetical protein
MSKSLPFRMLYILTILFLVSSTSISGQNLESGFANPPQNAKPLTWWHWTNSNITKEGITKDLEWMKRSGIGGFQLADVASGSGQTVEKKLLFGTPEWLDAVRHAASEADRLGLEMSIFSSPGWSITGGPWVKPEQAMKKLVWSEVSIRGPVNSDISLPPLPSVEGPIRNMSRGAQPGNNEPRYSKDFVVLAFPTPQGEAEIQDLKPVIRTGAGIIKGDALLDDDLNTSQRISAGIDRKIVWIEFKFEKPFTARSITLAGRNGIPVGRLMVSDDGIKFNTLVLFPGAQLYRAGKVETISFPEATGSIFRLEFTGAPLKPADVMAETTSKPDSVYIFSELKLHGGARINRWEDKAGFFHLFNYDPVESSSVPANCAIDPSAILNITGFLQPDGSLKWKAPAGNWTIMRFGYSLTGSRNKPPVSTGAGYEVDKLSKEYTEGYIKNYTDPIAKALGSLYGKSLSGVLIDSWEAGMQNWTDKMEEEFTVRRGYDPLAYLPCLAGRVVGSAEISDRFLWDFRRTLADMFAENHYKTITDYLHKQGLKTYGEASGVSLEILEDALLCKKYVDIPMGEFWYRALHPELMYYQDIRGAASASHIYGKNIVGAESFTGGGFDSPYSLKKIGDYWFTQGVNRIIFHTSAHQPLDTKPGNTMVGTHINRNITWAEEAQPFMNYLSRISFMLQQGKPVADILYLLDEGAPSTMPIWGSGLNPAPSDGFDYDYINADALLSRISVNAEGRLALPEGISYKVLILPNTDKMSIPVLKKIHDLVQAGAIVAGRKPLRTPGLTGFPGSEQQLKELVFDLWGDLDGISRTKRTFGKGQVLWSVPIDNILSSSGTIRDFEFSTMADAKISWIHRSLPEGEIYFFVNGNDSPVSGLLKLHTSGMIPEKWDPADGSFSRIEFSTNEGITRIPVQFDERESFFIVFRKSSPANSAEAAGKNPVSLDTLRGAWEIRFPEGLGAPLTYTAQTLSSWTENPDEGIKYFSGSATYIKSFTASSKWFKPGTKFIIDLGKVGDIAQVSLNGTDLGIMWKPPFRADITSLLRKGENRIEVKVTNEWTNRLAGDQKAGPGKKVLNSPLFVFGGRKLDNSGLLGPVTILTWQTIKTY